MNSTNKTTFIDTDTSLFDQLIITYYTLTAIFMVLGTFLNLWLLSAIATSVDLRGRMRNKLIMVTCVINLTECCIEIPLFFAMWLGSNFECQLYSAYVNIGLIEDFVSNWILVEMIVLYLCQIMDLKISGSLSVYGQRIVTISVLLLPWVASLITVPAIIHSEHRANSICFFPKSYEIFKCIDSVVPLLLSVILLVVAIVKKRNRYRTGFSARNMQVELISRGPELDETSAYVLGLTVCFVCDTGAVILLLEVLEHTLLFGFCAFILETSRVVFMMLPWLLFKDIRTRMKTWRPWYRPLPGIDLTLEYSKDQDEQANNNGQ